MEVNMYMPKSAVPVSNKSTGYMPKSAVPIKKDGMSTTQKAAFAGGIVGDVAGDIVGTPIGMGAPLSGFGAGMGTAIPYGVESLVNKAKSGKLGMKDVITGAAAAYNPMMIPALLAGEGVFNGSPEAKKDIGVNAALGAAVPVGFGIAGKTLGKTVPVVSKAASMADNVLKQIPVVGQAETMATSAIKGASESMKANPITTRMANNLLEISKTGREILEDRKINLGENFATDVKNGRFAGVTAPEIRESVVGVKNQVGKQLETTIGQLKESVDLTPFLKKAIAEADEKIKTNASKKVKEFYSGYMDEITPYVNTKIITPAKAFEIKKSIDELLFLASGKETRSTITDGTIKAQQELAKFLRSKLREFKPVTSMFDDYERLSFYDNALAGHKLPGTPTSLGDFLAKISFGQAKNPATIMKYLANPPKGIPTKTPKISNNQMEALQRLMRAGTYTAGSSANLATQ